ncbi:MAG: lipid A biosynthesis acyltransferase [Ferruginibacter sp.]
MYYLIYGFLYLISLLPFWILYGISDIISFCIFYLGGYRKKIVLYNLGIAFPEKTGTEKKKIAWQFYRNLIDTFIETIKLLSMSDKSFRKRATMDVSIINEVASRGKSIQFHSGHQMNWEYGNYVMANKLPIPWIGIYMKISNRALNRLFYHIRAKKGTVLVATKEFKSRMHEVFRQQYSLGLAADQNPGEPHRSNWLYFFTKAAPFVTGPDKAAIKNNTAVIFVKFLKRKRGHYEFITKLITEDGALLKPGELTLMYRDFLEETIRESPDNYLWSHRRWKWEYKTNLEHLWIDKVPPPGGWKDKP